MLEKLNILDSQYYLSINGVRTSCEDSWINIGEKFNKLRDIYIKRGFDAEFLYNDKTDEFSAIFVKGNDIKVLEAKLYQ